MVDLSIVMLVFQGCVISWKFEDIEYYIFSGLLGVPAQTNYSDFWNGNSHVTYYQNFTQNTSQHTNKHFLLPWKTNMEPENTIEKGWKTSTHTTNFWVPVASKIEGVLATRGLQYQNFLGTWSFNENFSELSLPISPLREKEMIQLLMIPPLASDHLKELFFYSFGTMLCSILLSWLDPEILKCIWDHHHPSELQCKNCRTSLSCFTLFIWVFPKIGVPQNGWFIMENLIKMDDLGRKTHHFRKQPFRPLVSPSS